MIDREKVLEAIERCIDKAKSTDCYTDCYYDGCVFRHGDCRFDMLADALALLKEQEAIEPRRINGKRNHFIQCGNCNYDLLTGYLFCPHCGKAVKWNE